ncbi:MAG: hypothetical protein ACT4R6_05860, partial [Gemmatimonadaceae bacterium]
ADTVLYPGEGFVDVPRTTRLWREVYQAPQSLIERDRWIDAPSAGIPGLYMTTGLLLADLLRSQGDGAVADSVIRRTDALVRAARLNHWFNVPLPSQMMPGLAPADTVVRPPIPLGDTLTKK